MSKFVKRDVVRTVPIWTLRFTPGYRWNSRKLLKLVPFLCCHGQTIAVAVQERGIIMDGNNVVRVLRMLQRRSVMVVNTDGCARDEIRFARLATSTLPFEYYEGKEAEELDLQFDFTPAEEACCAA